MSEPRARTSLFLKLGLMAFSVALALLAVEGACRAYLYFFPGPPTSHYEFRLRRPPPYQDASYFSKEFIDEQFVQPAAWRTDPSFGWIPKDYDGKFYHVRDEKRVTTDTPPAGQVKHRILLFGGSTMYCSEVPDDQTIPSQLQRLLSSKGFSGWQVENFGATTITIRQQLARLKMQEPKPGDIVAFYDGVNDATEFVFHNNPDGHMVAIFQQQLNSLKPHERFLFKLHMKFSQRSAFVRVFLNPIKGGQAPPKAWNDQILANTEEVYLRAILEAREFCQSKGAQFYHFLQPTLFIAPNQTAYEKELLANPWLIPRGMEEAFAAGYPRLRSATQKAAEQGVKGGDLTAAFDSRKNEIFLDYCHINHQGNGIIAQKIFEAVQGEMESDKPAAP